MGRYNAIFQGGGDWRISWIEAIPGVNSQGATREELMAPLEINRADARAQRRATTKKRGS